MSRACLMPLAPARTATLRQPPDDHVHDAPHPRAGQIMGAPAPRGAFSAEVSAVSGLRAGIGWRHVPGLINYSVPGLRRKIPHDFA